MILLKASLCSCLCSLNFKGHDVHAHDMRDGQAKHACVLSVRGCRVYIYGSYSSQTRCFSHAMNATMSTQVSACPEALCACREQTGPFDKTIGSYCRLLHDVTWINQFIPPQLGCYRKYQKECVEGAARGIIAHS